MYYIAYIFLFLTVSLNLISCKSSKEFSTTTIESATKQPQTIESFSDDIYAFIFNDEAVLDKLIPTVEVVKQIASDETKGKSDSEIENKMIAGLKQRLQDNALQIKTDIESSGYSLDQVKYTGYKSYPEDAQGAIEVLAIELTAGDKKGMIPITYTEYDGRFYWFEILISTNIIKSN